MRAPYTLDHRRFRSLPEDTRDVPEYAPLAGVVVPVSGDGDFDLLVHKARDKHRVSVEVYGIAELTAASLIRAADKFILVKDHLLLGTAARGE